MTAEGFELPDATEQLKTNLRDDVRAFLLKRLAWTRLSQSQRDHLRQLGVDKQMRRPAYLAVEAMIDGAPPEVVAGRCEFGAEGVMSHADEDCVHLAFKCGNPRHPFHYSTFGLDTIISLAKACEATWPGTVSRNLIKPRQTATEIPPAEEDKLILDPGDDAVDLTDDEAEEDYGDPTDGSECAADGEEE